MVELYGKIIKGLFCKHGKAYAKAPSKLFTCKWQILKMVCYLCKHFHSFENMGNGMLVLHLGAKLMFYFHNIFKLSGSQMRPHKMWGLIWDPNSLTLRFYSSTVLDRNYDFFSKILKDFSLSFQPKDCWY